MLTFPEIKQSDGVHSELQNLGFPAVLKYLRDRGVGEGLINDLGIHIMPAAEVIRRSRGQSSADDRLAVVIPHFTVAGDYINWWSARLIDTGLRPVVASFAALAPHKRGKMYCPPNEPPHAYLPPILDWRLLQKGDRVYIHESCIKAINGARLGYWSIGLNGVWGWGSRKHNLGLVQEMRDLPWRALQLQPVIVFDSNAVDNWDVRAAITQLTAKLLEITGQHAKHILLPVRDGGGHRGFDDLCVERGDEAARAYLDGTGELVEIGGVAMLKLKLSSEVCVVRSLGRVAEQETCTLMTRGVFTDVNYAHYVAEVEDKWVNVPRLWLSDTRRVEVEGITYAPGKDRITDGNLNSWRGMGLEPEKGDVSVWLGLIEKNVPHAPYRKWLLQWMAYPLQNLGVKLHTFVHLFGPPGSGKQAIFAPLVRAYGVNAVTVGQPQMTSSFNSIYANKQLINIDELFGGSSAEGTAVANKIKMLTTDDTLLVNTKGQPEYTVPNCAQIVITSNYSDSLKYDDDDRRGFVLRFGTRGQGETEGWWIAYWDWLDAGGAAAVLHYLMTLDVSDFNPKGKAPLTEDKADVTQSTRRVDEQWVAALYKEPDDVLPPILGGRCLMTTKELSQYCYGEDPAGITPNKTNMLGIKLTSAGFGRVELKIAKQKERFWIIRRTDEEWSAERARNHLKTFKYPGVK